MTSRKSGSGPRTKTTTVAITRGSGKATPIRQDLPPSADANGRHARIAARAYALYRARGNRPGGDLQDWLDAEREIVSHELQT